MNLKGWIVVISVAFFAHEAFAESPREEISFDKGWKFQTGDPEGASKADFDDSKWQSVTVPHDYAIEGAFDEKSAAGDGGGYLSAGKAWYRKTFTLPAEAKGKRVGIRFDGVYMNSDVYLNGKLLGNHPYGYTPIFYDLTDGLNFDAPNTLAVFCNVEQPSSRWYSGAGIFRHVHLVTTDPVHIVPWGTYLTTEKGKTSEIDFTVTVRATVRNDSDKDVKCKTTTMINPIGAKNGWGTIYPSEILFDPRSSQFLAKAEANEQTVPAHQEITFASTCKVPEVHLWSIDSPYLYQAVINVSVDGKTVDSVTDPVGFRTIEFTKDNGCLLNGKRLQIQGVCNHHDLGALGAAVNRSALQRQLQLLKDMGCNALRTSHNPPTPELLELADEMGFVVMDEAFDEWLKPKRKFGYGRFFDDWSERDLTAMIHRDRNHPCVVLWSIGNEIPEQGAANGGEMAKRLADIAHREDPTRPVTSACNNPNGVTKNGYADALDVFGINYHPGNYKTDKGRVLIGSETSSALSTRGEYGLYLDKDGTVKIRMPPGDRPEHQCVSYDLDKPNWGATAETSLLAVKNSPWVAGEFVWTGFDYIGEPTPYKWPSRSSYFGIIDLAGFPKDRFYLYQSQWTDKPMVHLLPHWNWKEFEGKEIPVWAFSNADAVELFLNGKSLGTRTAADRVKLHFEWNVPYEPGTLKAVAKKNGKEVASDEVVTAGEPARLELTADWDTIRARPDELAFITVKVVDKDGHVCPNADHEIEFSLDGPASIAGLDNGDPTNHESFHGSSHRAFHGLALAILRSNDKPGIAKLTAKAEGLRDGTVDITLK